MFSATNDLLKDYIRDVKESAFISITSSDDGLDGFCPDMFLNKNKKEDRGDSSDSDEPERRGDSDDSDYFDYKASRVEIPFDSIDPMVHTTSLDISPENKGGKSNLDKFYI